MAYKPTVWVDDETPVNAENLNKLEQGVAEIHTAKENGELDGTPGKSAYEYAQDGGYTGTEAEFARKLASESSAIHIGSEPPADENVKVWIDTDEEPEASGVDVTAEVGQTIVVEEVNENGKPTKWKAMDYQPRTHWSEVVSTVLIDNQTYPVDQELYHDFPLVVGQSYHVVFDGVEYDEIAKPFDAGGMTIVYLGNVGMFDVDQDNGMPYTVMYFDGMGTSITPMGDTGEQFTVSISTIGEVVHKLPEKFLPETTPLYIIIGDDLGEYFTSASVSALEEAYAKGREIIAKFLFGNDEDGVAEYRFHLGAVFGRHNDNIGKEFAFYSNHFDFYFTFAPNEFGSYDVTQISKT